MGKVRKRFAASSSWKQLKQKLSQPSSHALKPRRRHGDGHGDGDGDGDGMDLVNHRGRASHRGRGRGRGRFRHGNGREGLHQGSHGDGDGKRDGVGDGDCVDRRKFLSVDDEDFVNVVSRYYKGFYHEPSSTIPKRFHTNAPNSLTSETYIYVAY